MSIDTTKFGKQIVEECIRTSLLAFGGGSLPFFSGSPSFLGSFSASSVLTEESSTAGRKLKSAARNFRWESFRCGLVS